MAQSLELNIKTTSEVPQAMEKAKSATVSFGKQVEDVQKKFSTAFKDIFLSFVSPLALLGTALAFIGRAIEENRKRQEDARQAAIDGTNELISAEDRYWANKKNNENKDKENAKQAKISREQTTFEFMQQDPRGRKIYQDYLDYKIGDKTNMYENRKYNARYDPEVQAAVQAIIAEDAKKNPVAMGGNEKATTFKGPEGFSNVIGVGANPVIEAMTKQNEILEEIKVILQESKPTSNGVPTPFTERLNVASRTGNA